jgi:hypothetical protein
MLDLMSSSLSSAHNLTNIANLNANSNSTATLIQNLKLTNPKAAKILADYKQIILELSKNLIISYSLNSISSYLKQTFFQGAQNFDVIRFATYRTASKLRFIQKKLNCKILYN